MINLGTFTEKINSSFTRLPLKYYLILDCDGSLKWWSCTNNEFIGHDEDIEAFKYKENFDEWNIEWHLNKPMEFTK